MQAMALREFASNALKQIVRLERQHVRFLGAVYAFAEFHGLGFSGAGMKSLDGS
jgi:hypothetical protein